MKFIGNYSNTLDNKGRVTIPSKFRKELGKVIMLSFEFENTLVLRDIAEFKKWSKSIVDMSALSKDARTLQRLIFGNTEQINIDSKGRINISLTLLKTSKITNDVQIVGVGNKIEIHSVKNWNELSSSKTELLKDVSERAFKLEK